VAGVEAENPNWRSSLAQIVGAFPNFADLSPEDQVYLVACILILGGLIVSPGLAVAGLDLSAFGFGQLSGGEAVAFLWSKGVVRGVGVGYFGVATRRLAVGDPTYNWGKYVVDVLVSLAPILWK
jgi:hypothetical protein